LLVIGDQQLTKLRSGTFCGALSELPGGPAEDLDLAGELPAGAANGEMQPHAHTFAE